LHRRGLGVSSEEDCSKDLEVSSSVMTGMEGRDSEESPSDDEDSSKATCLLHADKDSITATRAATLFKALPIILW